MILVISNSEFDGHVPPVTAELSRRGRHFVIYNPATYPDKSSLTLESSSDAIKAFLSIDDSLIDLSCVTSVWYRRPGDFALSDKLSPEEDRWLRAECRSLFQGFWSGEFLPQWVSNPEAIRKASLKAAQLKVAMEMGFTVPRFTITNDVDRASRFIASCRQGTIVKTLGNPSISYPDLNGTIYTHLVSNQDMDLISSVRFGPTYLQECIKKRMDVRVTVIGEKVFAVGIDSQNFEESSIDFRRSQIYTLPHHPIELPRNLSRLSIELVGRLGLRFGAIDFILTPDGDYIFLEINPNGQWYWLEEITGLPLVAAMCDLLTAGAGFPAG
ncbi:MvdC/MvdD family ATP grasp protein [Streptomyces sp. MMG1121]|uniref:MvdC/MvdD family ATP grasp protein n=1 Tax=Streptomyces sp. MMG1121 TaxID=1415544 RepID=UPI000A9411C5|nr:hypothetical protein [Streptomyces sp. MMG1121]